MLSIIEKKVTLNKLQCWNFVFSRRFPVHSTILISMPFKFQPLQRQFTFFPLFVKYICFKFRPIMSKWEEAVYLKKLSHFLSDWIIEMQSHNSTPCLVRLWFWPFGSEYAWHKTTELYDCIMNLQLLENWLIFGTNRPYRKYCQEI